MKIDWNTAESHVLVNSAYSTEEQVRFQKIKEIGSEFVGHIWLSTSGTQSPKWVGLSKQAILTSAQAVNHHLASTSQDRWMQTLPEFHIGGLSLWARAYLTGASVIDVRQSKWRADVFYEALCTHQATLTSLVPTQLYDLVQLQRQPPASLRAILVGGGALAPALYQEAIQQGWKILPTYGMTECASQIATAVLDASSSLKILTHIEVCEVASQQLAFKGPSLFTTYAMFQQDNLIFHDPKQEGWFISTDRGYLDNGYLTPLGRLNQMVKIGGENVDLAKLEAILAHVAPQKEIALVAVPDPRLEHSLLIAYTGCKTEAEYYVLEFNQHVLPFERVRATHAVPYIPKNALGKIQYPLLLAMLVAI